MWEAHEVLLTTRARRRHLFLLPRLVSDCHKRNGQAKFEPAQCTTYYDYAAGEPYEQRATNASSSTENFGRDGKDSGSYGAVQNQKINCEASKELLLGRNNLEPLKCIIDISYQVISANKSKSRESSPQSPPCTVGSHDQ